MSWQENAIMYWHDGNTFQKITDHGRQPLSITVERIENKQRMADGTMRRYVVAKKRSWNVSWENIPSRRNPTRNGVLGLTTVDGGWAGEDIENFHNETDGPFKMRLRGGDDESKPVTDGTIEEVTVMISDYSREVEKRGIVDYWNIDITLEEC